MAAAIPMTSSVSSATNPSLISRVRTDDARAWRELVELYGPLVKYWCRRQGLSAVAADDCAQDIFLAVLKSIHRYEPNDFGKGFRAWLWGIARHKIVDELRRGGRHPLQRGGSTAMQQLRVVPEELSHDDQSEAIELNRLLRRGVEQIRAEFAETTWRAFWRTTIDGVPTALVAEELGIQPATIRQHRSRVLRRLRTQLGDQIQ